MIGLILGTSEGKKILSLLNGFTNDIFVSTATNYGGQLLENYKYKVLNTEPLKFEDLIYTFRKNKVNILLDASHPYAIEITQNAIKACEILKIKYLRYERPSCLNKFGSNSHILKINGYEELKSVLKDIDGNVLNTSGSRNIKKILSLNIKNRMIHRVLPSAKAISECYQNGISVDDIIAIKGPISYDLNCSFIREYDVRAMIMKDSGIQGGTFEKIKSCIDNDIYAIVIGRKKGNYKNVFYSEEEAVNFIKKEVKGVFYGG
ncbi:cobalt-precorrin-6A reductase [Clostridium fermenticellae]|uniref:Cobalt-precorrin-6A reductase n=1 Tax=Clostridium fermenticellae TaxID=2068654 RepID=A0A386H678_9CLOT|nr:cobalt-precorrin-6A reductase [Clostridium fermenticellae]AYD41025.1 cobalt-precorrin-6A reductase [Clostridium fermenticellae]